MTPRLLEECAFSRVDLERHLDLESYSRTPAARRRKNLRRAIDRWVVATAEGSTRIRTVMLMTLTFRDADPMAARHAITRFWAAYRQTYGRRPYFSWVELQYRGAVHYHAIVINEPWQHRGKAVKWIRAHWPHADITPRLDYRDKRWFIERGGAYVKAYAKDPAKQDRLSAPPVPCSDVQLIDKGYQQAYEDLPREIRTYEHSDLEWYVKHVDLHRDRAIVVNLAPDGSSWDRRLRNFWLMHYLHHDPEPGRCTLRLTTKRRRPDSHRRRFERIRGASTPTRASRASSAREPV